MQVQEVSSTVRNDYITFCSLHFLVNTFIVESDESSITLTEQKYKMAIIKSLSTPVYIQNIMLINVLHGITLYKCLLFSNLKKSKKTPKIHNT